MYKKAWCTCKIVVLFNKPIPVLALSLLSPLLRLPNNRDLNIPNGDDNENFKKAIGLISKTTILHVHHAFLHISLPSLHDYDVKLLKFTFYGGSKQTTTKFSLFFLNLNIAIRNSNPREFANIWQSKWVAMIAMKIERTRVHFLGDVFATVVVLRS